ncbi:hypothetical protein AC1031_000112 [Aphanomyces cochlioides]|nr:hypothetical protein AC1031_000112 [Aphanomyces cochlioides]
MDKPTAINDTSRLAKTDETTLPGRSRNARAYAWSYALVALAVAVALASIRIEMMSLPWPFHNDTTIHTSSSLFAPLDDRYDGDLYKITTRKLLTSDVPCTKPDILGDLTHVDDVLGRADQLRQDGKVFLMLNGQNEGVYAEWTKENGCLHALAETAALVLGSDPDYFANGLRLYNGMGYPITTADELDAERVAYILVDFQIWVWPGIHVGYTRIVDNVKMTTISLVPLVFDSEGFFTLEEANLIIEHGSVNLKRSRVVGTDDGYHSHRTSFTAYLDNSVFTRDFCVRTARAFKRSDADIALVQFVTWCKWAASVIDAMDDRSTSPQDFHPGNRLHPDANDKVAWQLELVKKLLEPIIASWTSRSNTPALQVPKEPSSGTAQYFRWIHWAQERIAHLGDDAPAQVLPTGEDYPSFASYFQNQVSHKYPQRSLHC